MLKITVAQIASEASNSVPSAVEDSSSVWIVFMTVLGGGQRRLGRGRLRCLAIFAAGLIDQLGQPAQLVVRQAAGGIVQQRSHRVAGRTVEKRAQQSPQRGPLRLLFGDRGAIQITLALVAVLEPALFGQQAQVVSHSRIAGGIGQMLPDLGHRGLSQGLHRFQDLTFAFAELEGVLLVIVGIGFRELLKIWHVSI